MRRSRMFAETLREQPTDADSPGYALLLRGGFIQSVAAGIFSYLPLGFRVKAKIEAILQEEMDAIGGQQVSLPVWQPASLWQESGRWQQIGPELVRLRDRGEREMVLALSHEEAIADLIRRHVRSYRQLPVMLYQMQLKFRDEPRARGGLIRAREFVMKDAYSAHSTVENLDEYYPRVCEAYMNIFGRCGLSVRAVEADVGLMGGTLAHEFMYLSDIGEDQILICDGCGYAANRQVAAFRMPIDLQPEPLPVEKVATPDVPTIAALARLLDVPESKTAKAAFFMSGEGFIFAVIRGDMEVNESKLAAAVGAAELRPARLDEVQAAGIVAGYASPIGVSGATVVADEIVARSTNLIAGANEPGFHLLNTNIPRDFRPDIIADIADAYSGAPCSVCGSPLRMVRGVEVGNTFKLGTRYSRPMGLTYLDADGVAQDVILASYGIGVGRLLGCIAQEHRDQRGLVWPLGVAPFEVYLVGLDLDRPDVREAAESVYRSLHAAGIEVLYDDRTERPGVKFNDADLLGMPLRLTVSRRSLEKGSVESKDRAGSETILLSFDAVTDLTRARLQTLAGTG